MAAHVTRITPGKRLVRTVNKALKEGCEWTETEQIALGLIEEAGDRVAVLRDLFDAETAKPAVSTRRVTELAAEIRQTEATIALLVAQLIPDPDGAPTKSAQHQRAANSRWHRG